MQTPSVVAVTGATAGRAVARRYAARGAAVGLITRGRDALEATAEEVENLGGKALPAQADVASFDQVRSAAQRMEREHNQRPRTNQRPCTNDKE